MWRTVIVNPTSGEFDLSLVRPSLWVDVAEAGKCRRVIDDKIMSVVGCNDED
jgi:hypothetical protein